MDYEIVYSNRKTISLCVKCGSLIVRAPFFTSKRKIDEIVSSHREWIDKSIEKQRAKSEKYDSLTDEKIASLRKAAKQILPIKVAHYAKIMGLKYGRITITGAKTRFGSCSSKGNISFSYLLMLYPEEAIDYVVVHELAHLVEMNHSSRFYKIVEGVLPDYKERKKLLKK
ncbi:MAG: M48 family metallopeptidase [Clostridia bacterium]|nr:M48 family metallopeptidase [Clostridia bacterium]